MQTELTDKLADILKINRAEVYLHGSRSMNMHDKNSDYDVVYVGSKMINFVNFPEIKVIEFVKNAIIPVYRLEFEGKKVDFTINVGFQVLLAKSMKKTFEENPELLDLAKDFVKKIKDSKKFEKAKVINKFIMSFMIFVYYLDKRIYPKLDYAFCEYFQDLLKYKLAIFLEIDDNLNYTLRKLKESEFLNANKCLYDKAEHYSDKAQLWITRFIVNGDWINKRIFIWDSFVQRLKTILKN